MAATLGKAALFIASLAGAFVLTRNTPFFYNLRTVNMDSLSLRLFGAKYQLQIPSFSLPVFTIRLTPSTNQLIY